MRCANCGKGVLSAAAACPFCGEPFTANGCSRSVSVSTPVISAVPKMKIKLARWHLMLAGAIVIAGLTSFFVFWATSGLIEPIQRQLDAFRRDDLQAAYAEMSVSFHREVPFEKFSEFVRSNPSLSHNVSHRFMSRSSSSSPNAGGTGTGDVKGSITDDLGSVLPVQYALVKENGTWRIKGIHLGRKIAAQPG
jgi:uncharacterized protein DUF4864